MDYTFLWESNFLIEMAIVAVGVVVLGVMIRKQKPASKNQTIDGKR